MAELIFLETRADHRGKLSFMEEKSPFPVKRVFYIYDVPEGEVRGGHRHKENVQGLICVKGQCTISCHDGREVREFVLDRPDQCLVVHPEDWHQMYGFSGDAVLLVLASEKYDPNDYIFEKY